MLQRIVALGFAIAVIALTANLAYDHWWRCPANGLEKQAAIVIANGSLAERYTNIRLSFLSATRDGTDWIITYRNERCTVDVVINRCGAADIGGVTRDCP
jgi:hypothetical protein